ECEMVTKTKKSFLDEIDVALPKAISSAMTKKTDGLTQSLTEVLLSEVKSLPDYQNLQPVVIDLSESDMARLKEHRALAEESKKAAARARDSLIKTSSELESLSINLRRAPSQDELIELYERLTVINKHV